MRGDDGGSGARRLVLVLLGLLLGAACLEVAARLAWTRPWYDRLVAEQADPEWRDKVRRNALGLRDRDYATPRPDGVERVLLLGDSFSFGSGVVDEEKIFASLLETRLSAEPGRRVEILNASKPGSLTGDWLSMLRRVGPDFRPDVVLVVFFLHDGTRTTAGEDFFHPIRTSIAARNRDSWLYRHVYAWRWWRDVLDRRAVSDLYSRAIVQAYAGDEGQTAEWRAAQANLRTIRDEAAALGARTGLVVFPILADFGPGYPFREVCDRIEAAGVEAGLPTLDLLPAFRGEDAAALWVSPLNQHPNERGHEIAAQAILPFLRSLLAEGPLRRPGVAQSPPQSPPPQSPPQPTAAPGAG
ncbi:MAG: SGNH/GDSL hydrolase family protein [Alphaproteobacteria bacterium]